MEEKIKGFSKDEIFELCRFAEIFESDIKGQKVDDVAKKYLEFSKKRWKINTKGLTHQSVKENSHYERPISNNTLWDRSNGIARDHVTKHIRNAFAHLSIAKDSESSCVSLIDKYPTKVAKKKISAKYMIDDSLFWRIIRIFTRPTKQ